MSKYKEKLPPMAFGVGEYGACCTAHRNHNVTVIGDVNPKTLEKADFDTTVGMNDGHTWWNSQIHSTENGREYTIQMGTLDKEVFDKVSKLLAQVMDEEYAKRHS